MALIGQVVSEEKIFEKSEQRDGRTDDGRTMGDGCSTDTGPWVYYKLTPGEPVAQKALISCTVTAKLICAFVFAYAKGSFLMTRLYRLPIFKVKINDR